MGVSVTLMGRDEQARQEAETLHEVGVHPNPTLTRPLTLPLPLPLPLTLTEYQVRLGAPETCADDLPTEQCASLVGGGACGAQRQS